MLEKVKQMVQAFLETIKAKGEESIETVELTHVYQQADDEGSTMMSAAVKVDFKIEPKSEAEPAAELKPRGGEVH